MKLGSLGQRERFLLTILAILAPFAAWQYLKPVLLDFASGGSGGIGGASGVKSRMKARGELAPLRLAVLEAESGEYEPDRNIFRYGERPKPPPPPPLPPPPVNPRPRVAPPPRQAAEPQPPPVDVSLLGIFGPVRRRIAVLTDEEGAIINALEREVIHEKFIVHQIGLESIDLAFVGFPNAAPQRLELGG